MPCPTPARIGGCSICDWIDPAPVWIDAKGAAADDLLKADCAAHFVCGLGGPIEDCARVRSGFERLILDDADRRQHAAPNGVANVGAVTVEQQLELVEAQASLIGSMLTGTPDAPGNCIGLAPR
jgi:hypothetical protein